MQNKKYISYDDHIVIMKLISLVHEIFISIFI